MLNVILSLLTAFFIVFPATFAIIMLYIAFKRRKRAKHHFTGVIEMTSAPTDAKRDEPSSAVDSGSAMKEWRRK